MAYQIRANLDTNLIFNTANVKYPLSNVLFVSEHAAFAALCRSRGVPDPRGVN